VGIFEVILIGLFGHGKAIILPLTDPKNNVSKLRQCSIQDIY